MTVYTATYGERRVSIRSLRATPYPMLDEGTFYRVTLDGEDMPGLHPYLDDAKRDAEERIGVGLRWEERR